MKTEKQLTAVEWLCNEWLYLDQQFDMCLIDRNIYWDKLRQIQEQAKEMEKEQMLNAFQESRLTHPMIGFKHETFVEYYKQFKQQEQ